MVDPFGQNRGEFRYGAILRSIKRIAAMVTSAAEADEQGADPDVAAAAAAAAQGGREGAHESTQHAAASATPAAADTSAGAGGSSVGLTPNGTQPDKMPLVGPVAGNRSAAGGADGGQGVGGAGESGTVSGIHASSPTR